MSTLKIAGSAVEIGSLEIVALNPVPRKNRRCQDRPRSCREIEQEVIFTVTYLLMVLPSRVLASSIPTDYFQIPHPSLFKNFLGLISTTVLTQTQL
jgi:hypothetical protein